MRWLRFNLSGVSMALAASLALAACNPEAPPVAKAVQPVQVVTVAYAPRAERWSYVGIVRARYESDLGFRVAGKVAERLVDIGHTVTAGQVIARLDPTDYRLSVESQEAERRAALSSREQSTAAESRFRSLLAGGHVSQAAVDQRIATADEARARVDRAERALALARNQLSYAELKAERAGVVSALPVEVGQVVAAGQVVARIAEKGELEAVVAIPENRIDAVREARASAELWSGSGPRPSAHLRELAPEADRATRTYQARFSIETPPAGLQLGRTVTVHLERGAAGDVVTLPLSAVVNDGQGASVWVIDPSGTRVARRKVEVLAFAQDHALVGAGLTAGERVVSLGAHMLDPGKSVRVVEQRADRR